MLVALMSVVVTPAMGSKPLKVPVALRISW